MNEDIVVKQEEIPFKYQPYCEQEVVGLFCLIASKLGIEIVTIRTIFPDCLSVDIATKENLSIEFEYLAGNFLVHGHDPEKCDIIVCWENDAMINKPRVISLKKYFPFLIENPLTKKAKFGISQVIRSKALNEGVPYPELDGLFQHYHPTNTGAPPRVLARLFKWGCGPFSDNGVLKIRSEGIIDEYKIQDNIEFMEKGKELLSTLQKEWELKNK